MPSYPSLVNLAIALTFRHTKQDGDQTAIQKSNRFSHYAYRKKFILNSMTT
jgi:hypothetical protein